MLTTWITRDSNEWGGELRLWTKKPERGRHGWTLPYMRDYSIVLPGELFLDITWETDPKEIKIPEGSPKESLGDYLRNLMGSYSNLVDVIRFYKKTGDTSLLDVLDLDHIEEAMKKMIEFSESKIMEEISHEH